MAITLLSPPGGPCGPCRDLFGCTGKEIGRCKQINRRRRRRFLQRSRALSSRSKMFLGLAAKKSIGPEFSVLYVYSALYINSTFHISFYNSHLDRQFAGWKPNACLTEFSERFFHSCDKPTQVCSQEARRQPCK